MSEAIITPQVLRWAIDRAQISVDTLANKTKIKLEKLNSWVNGDAHPTFRQAQEIASRLNIPFGYLFVSKPPEEKLELPDLRCVGDTHCEPLSINFRDLLNDVLLKQQWYHDYLLKNEALRLDFIGSFSINNNFLVVAEDIIRKIGINDELRFQSESWEAFLRKFIKKIEENGILVLRSGVVGNNPHRKLSEKEFRGFAICDRLAPLIFINSKDSKTAQIFTLAHELTHLWIGQSGISNPDLKNITTENVLPVEIFCNKVAAQVLVPKDTFLNDWRSDYSVDHNIYALVRKYRVSSVVILRRALELEKISRDIFFEYYQQEINRYTSRISEESGGDFYRTLFARNSKILSRAILTSLYEGNVLYRDAARLLGVKVNRLKQIADDLGVR